MSALPAADMSRRPSRARGSRRKPDNSWRCSQDRDAVLPVRPLFAPMCRDAIVCGAVPNALMLKLAVNPFMIASVTGLAEAAHFAGHLGLDLGHFAAALDAGPMVTEMSRSRWPNSWRETFRSKPQSSTCWSTFN